MKNWIRLKYDGLRDAPTRMADENKIYSTWTGASEWKARWSRRFLDRFIEDYG